MILRNDLLNDVRLAPVQPDTQLCLVRGAPGTAAEVLVPVLTARKDDPEWLHLRCHAKNVADRRQEIDDLVQRSLATAEVRHGCCGSPSRPRDGRPGGAGCRQWRNALRL